MVWKTLCAAFTRKDKVAKTISGEDTVTKTISSEDTVTKIISGECMQELFAWTLERLVYQPGIVQCISPLCSIDGYRSGDTRYTVIWSLMVTSV